MTQYVQDPALWALIAGTPLAATTIIRGRRAARSLRQENQGLRDHYAELENHYSASVKKAQEQAEEATRTALKSAMRTLQGLAAEQQLAISKLQSKYGESVILQDLLEIDHMNSQFGRRAQSIAVLCEGWLGRQRDVASVYDVVRSAQGRIRHFQRVEILSQVDFAVTSRAVEPVALALAELLDNATSYSAPETSVEINVRAVPKGICIVVDDAGVGMNEEEKARAAKLLSSERASGVSGLGNPPQFGFAVIGVLCERYGFTVSVDSTSPTGCAGGGPAAGRAAHQHAGTKGASTDCEHCSLAEPERPGTRRGRVHDRRRPSEAPPQAGHGHRAAEFRNHGRPHERGHPDPLRRGDGLDHGCLPARHAVRSSRAHGARGPHEQRT